MADEAAAIDYDELEDIQGELEVIEEVDAEDTAASADLPLKKLYQHHPECLIDYIEEVVPRLPLSAVPAGPYATDVQHKTYPFLTQYERTRILGLRANQLSQGAAPFIIPPKYMTDVRDIARLELEQKRLPFIIKRPLPNGQHEYWRLADLMQL
jgi:DNA-directed RNA polymerase subunit K/omega